MAGGGTLPLPTVEARCESGPPPAVAESGPGYRVVEEPMLRRVDGQAIDPDTLDTLEMVLSAPSSAQAMIKEIARHATAVENRLVELERRNRGETEEKLNGKDD